MGSIKKDGALRALDRVRNFFEMPSVPFVTSTNEVRQSFASTETLSGASAARVHVSPIHHVFFTTTKDT